LRHCLADLAAVEPLSDAEAAAALEAVQRTRVRRAEGRRVALLVRIGVAVVALVLLGYWGYTHTLATPSPLPEGRAARYSSALTPETWPTADGDLGRLRSEAPARIEGEEVWRQRLDAAPETAIVSDGERLYLALADGTLRALRSADGTELWRRSYEDPVLAAPALAGDRVFVAHRGGLLQALDAATGDVLWESLAEGALIASPLVRDGIVYLFGRSEWYRFDAETGDRLWRRGIDADWSLIERDALSPTVGGEYIAVAVSERVLVFDRETGEQTYWYDFLSLPDAIALEGNTVYALSHRVFVSLEADSRRPWWDGLRRAWLHLHLWGLAPEVPPIPRNWVRLRPPREHFQPAIGAELVFVAGARGSVAAYHKADGTLSWTREIGRGTAPPTLTSTGLLVSAGRALILLDPASGSEIGRQEMETAVGSVAVVRHATYVALADGTLLALR
jgi:outer membrane protein assembly factor BamB